MRLLTMLLALSLAGVVVAQQEEVSTAGERLPEEVEILGDPSKFQLHRQMLEAEKNAYEVFNRFNDDERFHINCTEHARTATLLKTQLCQPGFEREALRAQGQAYLWSYQMLLESYGRGGGPPPNDMTPNLIAPAPAVIAKHRPEYQRKIRQVAEEHPEFLEAIMQYSELRERYEAATRTLGGED